MAHCLMLLLPCPPGHKGLYLQTVSQDNPFPAHSAFIRDFVATVREEPNPGRTANVTEGTVVGRCSHALLFVCRQWLLLHHVTKLNRFHRGEDCAKPKLFISGSATANVFQTLAKFFLKTDNICVSGDRK